LKFSDFALDESLMEGIDSMGYEKPSPIQELAIPIIMEGKDLIACAQTGTGKTAAFLLPLLHHILTSEVRTDKIKALIIAPTRELAVQIDQQLEGFAYFTGVSSIAVYGGGSGSDFETEKRALISGAEVIVATPGRLISHLNLGYVKFDALECLILDEADRMLDMGFLPDILKILGQLPKKRQTLMFSATMPSDIRRLAKTVLNNHKEINLAVSKPAENVLQAAYLVYDNQKIALIQSLISGKDLPLILIFAATKTGVKEIEKSLKTLKMNAQAIHSDLEQEQRTQVMNQFKSRQLQILVATDIVSRGIDVDDISLVINYNVPGDAEDYVHRVGRTARAEKSGLAITFINEYEWSKFKRIEALIESTVIKLPLPEAIGAGPTLEMMEKKSGKSFRHGFRSNAPKGRGGKQIRR
jgi:ATP-dependent RNA helicase RhlE